MPLSPEERASLKKEIAAEMLRELTAAEESVDDDEGEPEAEPELERHADALPELETYAAEPDPASPTTNHGSVASGTNGYVPGDVADDAVDDYCDDDYERDYDHDEEQPPRRGRSKASAERVKMQRIQCGAEVERYRREVANVRQENQALRDEVAELKRYNRQARRQAELTGLMAEGYEFNLADEVEDATDMDDTTFARHVNRIRTRYSRSPVGQPAVPLAPEPPPPADPVGSGISPEVMMKLVRYAADPSKNRKDRVTFEEAVERYHRGELKL